jgi:chemotaxis protein CheD
MTGLPREFLRPGDFCVARDPVIAETLVGSCVAVCLYNYKQGFGAMNHFLMDRLDDPPESEIGRYGISSTRLIVRAVLRIDPEPTHYRAGVFGGGVVLKTANDSLHIGPGNVQAAQEVLHEAHIRIAHQEVGGERGRRIKFNTQTGEMECRFAGDIPRKRAGR